MLRPFRSRQRCFDFSTSTATKVKTTVFFMHCAFQYCSCSVAAMQIAQISFLRPIKILTICSRQRHLESWAPRKNSLPLAVSSFIVFSERAHGRGSIFFWTRIFEFPITSKVSNSLWAKTLRAKQLVKSLTSYFSQMLLLRCLECHQLSRSSEHFTFVRTLWAFATLRPLWDLLPKLVLQITLVSVLNNMRENQQERSRTDHDSDHYVIWTALLINVTSTERFTPKVLRCIEFNGDLNKRFKYNSSLRRYNVPHESSVGL